MAYDSLTIDLLYQRYDIYEYAVMWSGPVI